MNEPETYPKLMMADGEQEEDDSRAGYIPLESFGAEIARRMNANPKLTAWAKDQVTITDLDGNCPVCHGCGCGDCLNEDSGDDR